MWSFTTVFTTACHWSPFWGRYIQSRLEGSCKTNPEIPYFWGKIYLVMRFKNCHLFIWQSTSLSNYKFILSSSFWFHFGRSSAPSCIKVPDKNWAIFGACEELQWCWLIWFEFLVPSKVWYLKENYISIYSVTQHKRMFHSWMGWSLIMAGTQFQI